MKHKFLWILFGMLFIILFGVVFLYLILQEKTSSDSNLEDLKNSQKVATSTLPHRDGDYSLCPEWVNCMPGPDINTRCIIPPGCEGHTQKAY